MLVIVLGLVLVLGLALVLVLIWALELVHLRQPKAGRSGRLR